MSVQDSGYISALERIAIADERAAGRIFMRGRDRAALLHRLSTNDIERLKLGEGTLTVLTTPIGRIIDLLTVHALDDALLIVTSPDQGPPVFGHLRRNIFFNDQVTLEAAGRTHAQIAVYGPQAARILAELTGTEIHLPLHGITTATLTGVCLMIARRKPIGGDSFTLYIPVDGYDAVHAALLAAGAATLAAATLDALRVEHGYGAFGRELSQEYIPLETGLLDAVSFTKGCYVGQEIIARMESRGRLAKRLCGLRLSTSVAAPAKLLVDGKDAGDLTSAVVSPRFGPIALAYVRTAHAEPGAMVNVAGSGATGKVVDLPFTDEQL
ncbi:YgfZ/GcvT domain-containing protein [Roseiflexus sp.]|uniref:CAF17-like 4Fe-4S cluster assembly/insertion protein YgfZ n=1 Tax=Roseiflexus sp. TaxID=2562120 RepID=UPI00398A8632